MAKQTIFVVSALGQDIFYDGAGGVASDVYSAAVYESFEDAETGAMDASFSEFTNEFGRGGLEIRTILYTN